MDKNGNISPASPESPRKKISANKPIVLVVVWVAIIVLFGYALWQGKSNKNNNTELSVTNEAIDDTNTSVGSLPLNMTNEQREQGRINDSKRLADIKILNTALGKYFKDNTHYPEKLENLLPKYLKDLPQDPNGYIYVYTGIGSTPYTYYELSYNLEVGVEGLEPGSHTASPDGIATP